MADPSYSPCRVERRPRATLGTTRTEGLRGIHHFCFAAYQRPDRMEWGALRCLNLYELEAGAVRAPTFLAGFDIITLLARGELRRLGTYAPPRPMPGGSVELISAGLGVHVGAESVGEEPVAFTEIWIASDALGEPRREWHAEHPRAVERRLAAGPDAAPDALRLSASATVSELAMRADEETKLALAEGEYAYLMVTRGTILANGVAAENGDGIAVEPPGTLVLRAAAASELLVIRCQA